MHLKRKVCVCVALQMGLLASTVPSCHPSAGQLTVSVLSLLALSAAARYGHIPEKNQAEETTTPHFIHFGLRKRVHIVLFSLCYRIS